LAEHYGLVSPTSIRSRILKGWPRAPQEGCSFQRFTHVDPFEDTERATAGMATAAAMSRFTHVDPFEDTESAHRHLAVRIGEDVSPTSIRSRILKDLARPARALASRRFTHVDPFEDTERDDAAP